MRNDNDYDDGADCDDDDDDDDDDDNNDDDEAVEVLPHSHQLLCVTKAMSGASLSSHTTALQCTVLTCNAMHCTIMLIMYYAMQCNVFD